MFMKIFLLTLIMFMRFTLSPTHARLEEDVSSGIRKIQQLIQPINAARKIPLGPTFATRQSMEDINNILGGKTSTILERKATEQERQQVWSAILTMHFHDKGFNVNKVFNSFDDSKVHHHSHFFALIIMHVAAQTVVGDKSVYFLSDSQLLALFDHNLSKCINSLSSSTLKQYINGLGDYRRTFIELALGRFYRDTIDSLSNVHIYRDISQAWAVNFFSCFNDKPGFRQNGFMNETHKLTDKLRNLIAFSKYDPEKFCEKHLKNFNVLPENFLRLGSRVVVYTLHTSEILKCIEKDYEELREKKRQKVSKNLPPSQWTKVFNLKNGLQAIHTPQKVSLAGMTGPFLILKGKIIFNNIPIGPLQLSIDMTEKQFMDELRRAGLL